MNVCRDKPEECEARVNALIAGAPDNVVDLLSQQLLGMMGDGENKMYRGYPMHYHKGDALRALIAGAYTHEGERVRKEIAQLLEQPGAARLATAHLLHDKSASAFVVGRVALDLYCNAKVKKCAQSHSCKVLIWQHRCLAFMQQMMVLTIIRKARSCKTYLLFIHDNQRFERCNQPACLHE